jgi:DNA-directed RNA polymerase specialized sigma54-like protein
MTNEDGEEVSTRIIKLPNQKLIEEEDTHNPITDDQVVKIFNQRRHEIIAPHRRQIPRPNAFPVRASIRAIV